MFKILTLGMIDLSTAKIKPPIGQGEVKLDGEVGTHDGIHKNSF